MAPTAKKNSLGRGVCTDSSRGFYVHCHSSTLDLDLGRKSQEQLVAVSHGLKDFENGMVFPCFSPWYFVLPERCKPQVFCMGKRRAPELYLAHLGGFF